MNQKILLFGVIVLVLVGVGGYMLGKKSPTLVENKMIIQPSPTSIAEQAGSYFEIKELGIKFKITENIKDLTYQINLMADAAFSTNSLVSYDSYCSSSQAAIGYYSKVYKSSLTNDPNDPWWKNEKGLKQATVKDEANNVEASAKEFSDFYILYMSPQAPCSTNQTAQALQTRQIQALRRAISTAELIK